MRAIVLWIAGLWMVTGLSQTAQATRVRYEEMACPLPDSDEDAAENDGAEGDVVRVYELVSSNTLGGYDSDTAKYSSDGQFREYAIATCADSLFSLYGEDMSAFAAQGGVPAAQAQALSAALERARGKLADPDEPEVWERYGIAAEMYAALGRSPMEVAELYLQASWVARDAVVGFHRGLEGPGAVSYLLEVGPAELEKPLSAQQRRTVLYSLARVAHRGGFAEERDDYLRQFAAVGPLTEGEQATLEAFQHIATEVEPRYQDLALQWLEKALRDPGLAEGARIRATYLMADLLRRRGRSAEARPLYAEVASHPDAAPLLREMASTLLPVVGG